MPKLIATSVSLSRNGAIFPKTFATHCSRNSDIDTEKTRVGLKIDKPLGKHPLATLKEDRLRGCLKLPLISSRFTVAE